MTTLELTPHDSINEAISTAPEGPLTLVLAKGTWREKVVVNRPEVMLVSEEGAVIETDDSSGMVRDGKTYGIRESATFTVAAPDFSAFGITFLNSFDYQGAQIWNLQHEEEKIPTEAVALALAFGSDKASFRACTFIGWNGTLYADSGVSFFEDCVVKGSQDFIFGGGAALFYGCEIISRGEGNVICPSTFREEPVGFIFHDSDFISEGDVGKATVSVARPWYPLGSVNRRPMALLVDCTLGKHVKPSLWSDSVSKAPDGTETLQMAADARFHISSHSRETMESKEAERLMRLLSQRRYS